MAEKGAAEGLKDSAANVRCWAFDILCTLVEKGMGTNWQRKLPQSW
ncbi:MAG: hypothetical protein AAGG81_03435 [Chlamydiota bacterium]